MAYAVRVLARPEIGTGFALAALTPVDAPTIEEGIQRLREVLEEPSVGVVLLEEDLYAALPDDVRRRVSRQPVPLLVPFPEPDWERTGEAPEAYIVELLRQVIGYRVRLT
jgi:vacuolar-type H+-ATPase subunit F/Vma7